MLNHSSIEHSRKHIPPPSFLLQVIQTLENDTVPMGETVLHIRKRVTKVTARHVHVPLYRHAETMATMLVWSSGSTEAHAERYCTLPRVCANAPSWMSVTMHASSGASWSHTIPKG